MADYGKKVQSGDAHLGNLTSAENVHIDGSKTPVVVVPLNTGCRLLKVVVNQKGLALNVKTGSRVIASLGTSTPENSYEYGAYCENGIQVDVSGTGDATLVFAH